MRDDKLILGGHEFHSRFILGSGKYNPELIAQPLKILGAEINHAGRAQSQQRYCQHPGAYPG